MFNLNNFNVGDKFFVYNSTSRAEEIHEVVAIAESVEDYSTVLVYKKVGQSEILKMSETEFDRLIDAGMVTGKRTFEDMTAAANVEIDELRDYWLKDAIECNNYYNMARFSKDISEVYGQILEAAKNGENMEALSEYLHHIECIDQD